MKGSKKLGVVVVLFNSADVVVECLESLFASRDVELSVVVVDNNSTDNSCDVVRDWSSGRVRFSPPERSPLFYDSTEVAKPVPLAEYKPNEQFQISPGVTLIESPVNGGFAYAVNLGLKALLAAPDIDLFWIFNPDCVTHPDTAASYIRHAEKASFALMGGLTIYYENPDQIQSYGGRVSRWTATCVPISRGCSPRNTTAPDASTVDFVTGANMVASRQFVERVGLMTEEYFLYYEEVDWAFRRGSLPIVIISDAVVYHHGGTSIGSGTVSRRATPFANYFNYRNRIMFARRYFRWQMSIVYLGALAKGVQLVLQGSRNEAWAIFRGVFNCRPPREVLGRVVDPAARKLAFGRATP